MGALFEEHQASFAVRSWAMVLDCHPVRRPTLRSAFCAAVI